MTVELGLFVIFMIAVAISLVIYKCMRDENRQIIPVHDVEMESDFIEHPEPKKKEKQVHFKETVLVHPIPSMKRIDFPDYFGGV